MFNSGAEATLEVEDEGEYTIIVNISFDKSNLSQSTVNVNANGTTMVVIQTNGTGLHRSFARLNSTRVYTT